jgi:hypothetical protein
VYWIEVVQRQATVAYLPAITVLGPFRQRVEADSEIDRLKNLDGYNDAEFRIRQDRQPTSL